MILKYRGYSMGKRLAWNIISDVTSVKHCRITLEQVKEDKLPLNDHIECLDENGKPVKNIAFRYIQAWHTRADDDPINLVTNMSAYLLNDDGKTVEKIN